MSLTQSEKKHGQIAVIESENNLDVVKSQAAALKMDIASTSGTNLTDISQDAVWRTEEHGQVEETKEMNTDANNGDGDSDLIVPISDHENVLGSGAKRDEVKGETIIAISAVSNQQGNSEEDTGESGDLIGRKAANGHVICENGGDTQLEDATNYTKVVQVHPNMSTISEHTEGLQQESAVKGTPEGDESDVVAMVDRSCLLRVSAETTSDEKNVRDPEISRYAESVDGLNTCEETGCTKKNITVEDDDDGVGHFNKKSAAEGSQKEIQKVDDSTDSIGKGNSYITMKKDEDRENSPACQVMGIKSEAEVAEDCVDLTGINSPEAPGAVHESTDAEMTTLNDKRWNTNSVDGDIACLAADSAGKIQSEEKIMNVQGIQNAVVEDDDDDVVILDDEDDMLPKVKKEAVERKAFDDNNDMGIQIESVSGGADELHKQAEQNQVKQETGVDPKLPSTVKEESSGSTAGKKASARTQTCLVCKGVGKCKYNIVRHGDVRHLCGDTCFGRFRAGPSQYLKGCSTTSSPPPTSEKQSKGSTATPTQEILTGKKKPDAKTCVVCLVMNMSSQSHFCMWKGMDFCGEACLGKFQAGISSYCTLCNSFIPLTARFINCTKLGTEIRPFCSSRCQTDYTRIVRLCAACNKDVSVTIGSFSSPVGANKTYKDFCSTLCLMKYEENLNSDVEIIRMERGKRDASKCNVCHKMGPSGHTIKYNGVVHNLCSEPCMCAFRYANKVDFSVCDFCKTTYTSLESPDHTVQFEGSQKRFCSEKCVSQYRLNHRKVLPCCWCGAVRENFDMIERQDLNNRFQLFCSLNCLSLYRVNLQAKSNQAVICDQCSKLSSAQYHLTMSDASVRNFCCYNCVMTFQAQFSKGTSQSAPTPAIPMPSHKHNTRGKSTNRSILEAAAAISPAQSRAASPPSVPVISSVVSLAPQEKQGTSKGANKSPEDAPPLISGNDTAAKKITSQTSPPVEQKIIIQPPPPKMISNKSLMCKPVVQTKGTFCRPLTQSKECQTDPINDKPKLIPVPVPVYLPVPMALYSAPTPTPVFIPVPIPVPVFIPTTRKSADGILKHIKEIQEKTPSDPLEAELLMLAAAASGEKENISESDSEDETLQESWKRPASVCDSNDSTAMPLEVENGGEEDMISIALRMAEEMTGPVSDLESAVEALPIQTETQPQAPVPSETDVQEGECFRTRRGTKRNNITRQSADHPKRARTEAQSESQPRSEQPTIHAKAAAPPAPSADAGCRLKFTYGINAWRHWVMLKNAQMESDLKPGSKPVKLFKADVLQCTADELNFMLCRFVKEVRKPNGEEYSPDSIYYLTLGLQYHLFENGRIDNIFSDMYYEKFARSLTEILSECQPKFNSSGQMVCRIEEEHLWESKQLGAHSPYVLLNTLIYFHTKYFMLKTPEDHMKLSFAHILKYWKRAQVVKGGQSARSVSLRYYSVGKANKEAASANKKGSKDGVPVFEVSENQENPLRCPVKLYEFYLSKCPESIKNRTDIFYPVPERSCVPDSPVWYSITRLGEDILTRMLTRILLVREIQEAHLHARPVFV